MTKNISNDLLLAIQIYRDQPKAWFGKLAEELSGIMDKDEVSHSLDILFDWGIVFGEYGPTADGRAGRLLFIDESAEHIIKELDELEKQFPQIIS
jgi:hypothetical protein